MTKEIGHEYQATFVVNMGFWAADDKDAEGFANRVGNWLENDHELRTPNHRYAEDFYLTVRGPIVKRTE